MRIGYGLRADGTADYDTGWWYWSMADAHHEDREQCFDGNFGHAVDDQITEPPGSFEMAEDRVWELWVYSGAHAHRDYQHWGNDARRTSPCNGDVAWNDGWVEFIEIFSP
jgi:hypothetical protein